MKLSVEASLQKLRTTYIDILYVHWWDYTTSVEELMDALNNLVVQGKVIYLVSYPIVADVSKLNPTKGASNFPAFRVAHCNQYARNYGKQQFAIYQGEWNVLSRDVEREILPLCQADGMAFAPWNIFCQGKLRTDAEEEERERQGTLGRKNFSADWKRIDKEKSACAALEKVGNEVGTNDIRAGIVEFC